MTEMIGMRGVRKAFTEHTVLDGLELDVRRGEVFALLGPNGAGKTTAINILSTLVKPDAGTARVAGFDVTTHAEEVKRRISLTGQSAAVDELLTGRENLRMMGRLWGLGGGDAAVRAEELLARFDLEAAAGKPARTYSGGMRRRLDLAISLLRTPPIVFLDEPTTGLDPRSRQELWNIIRTLATDGTTVLLTTQYLEEADQLADRIGVLDHGRLVAVGTPAELKSTVGGEVVTVADDAGAIIREVPTDGTPAGMRAALDALDAEGVHGRIGVRAPSLDDVFLTLTTDGRTPAATATSKGVTP